MDPPHAIFPTQHHNVLHRTHLSAIGSIIVGNGATVTERNYLWQR